MMKKKFKKKKTQRNWKIVEKQKHREQQETKNVNKQIPV